MNCLLELEPNQNVDIIRDGDSYYMHHTTNSTAVVLWILMLYTVAAFLLNSQTFGVSDKQPLKM